MTIQSSFSNLNFGISTILSLISEIELNNAIAGCSSSLGFSLISTFSSIPKKLLFEIGKVSFKALSIGIQSKAVLTFLLGTKASFLNKSPSLNSYSKKLGNC